MLPSVLAVLMLASFVLVFLDEKTISTLIGIDSGVWGMMIATVVGSVSLTNVFIFIGAWFTTKVPVMALLLCTSRESATCSQPFTTSNKPLTAQIKNHLNCS